MLKHSFESGNPLVQDAINKYIAKIEVRIDYALEIGLVELGQTYSDYLGTDWVVTEVIGNPYALLFEGGYDGSYFQCKEVGFEGMPGHNNRVDAEGHSIYGNHLVMPGDWEDYKNGLEYTNGV